MEDDLVEQSPYPAMFYAADVAAKSAQRWYLRLSACRLWALVAVAALAASVSLIDQWSAYIALVPIGVALFAEIILMARRLERRWYQTRAVAESAKTLTWRYQVGGRPLGLQMTDGEADAELIARLRALLTEFRDLPLPATNQDQVTAEMRMLRYSPLRERIATYKKGRIEDQRAWYVDRAEWNRKRADWYQAGADSHRVDGLRHRAGDRPAGTIHQLLLPTRGAGRCRRRLASDQAASVDSRFLRVGQP